MVKLEKTYLEDSVAKKDSEINLLKSKLDEINKQKENSIQTIKLNTKDKDLKDSKRITIDNKIDNNSTPKLSTNLKNKLKSNQTSNIKSSKNLNLKLNDNSFEKSSELNITSNKNLAIKKFEPDRHKIVDE